MLAEYLPILLFLVVATGVGIALLVLGSLLGPKRPEREKLSPYECGFEAFEDARMQFDVRYYLIAILFIVFDLEIAFVFPWAVVFRELGVVRPGRDGHVPRPAGARLRLRLEEGSARMGVIQTISRGDAQPDPDRDRSTTSCVPAATTRCSSAASSPPASTP